jgi:signal peptidase II
VPLLPVLDLTLLHNRGAAFSFLSDAGGWQRWFFATVAVVVSAWIALWLQRLPAASAGWRPASR